MRDRLLGLSQKKASPYTALSLLKAYGSFQIGICLILKKKAYESYTSVGLGMEKISIPQTALAGVEGGFYKIDAPELLSLKSMGPRMTLWAFPLDNQRPCRRVLLLAEEGGSLFNPPAIASIVSDARDIFILREEETGEEKKEGPEKTEDLSKVLTQYHKFYPSFQGIVLEPPDTFGEDEKDELFCQISAMVSSFATVTPLPSRRSLILFPKSMDRELVMHRLIKSLKAEVLCTFEADNPDSALELIQPYIDD
ncbi:MAG: hypothetical protein LBP93_03270 [Treponema sp.]|nr:hypothetical protein [Treponema sp.]